MLSSPERRGPERRIELIYFLAGEVSTMKTFAAFMLGVMLTVAVFLSGLKTGVAQDPVTVSGAGHRPG
jgi:hypothetical protein